VVNRIVILIGLLLFFGCGDPKKKTIPVSSEIEEVLIIKTYIEVSR